MEMALKYSQVRCIQPLQLSQAIRDSSRKVRIIDCRSFLEFNDNHVRGAINICCSKLIKRRLQQDKIAVKDLLLQCRLDLDEVADVVVYDQRTSFDDEMLADTFLYVLVKKLSQAISGVSVLEGGFISFHTSYPDLCEKVTWKFPGLSALSQPCLQTTTSDLTRILPFLYLGSEDDANNKDLLKTHNITYELNVSNKCPKPDFISEGHFLRIPVNDSNNEKLIQFFDETYQFVEKVREANECALVHCLAGISRSPTVAIAYVMRHLGMTCEEAYRYVKAKRATISPNFNFLGQLLEYEQQLISENVITNKNASSASCPPTSSVTTTDYFVGEQTVFASPCSSSLLSSKAASRRLNLSLRIAPYAPTGDSSPKDASPTTAMARLQFDKPIGKENRTGLGQSSSASCGQSSVSHTHSSFGFSLTRPTRLVKEQNVTSIKEEDVGLGQWESVTKSMTKQSISISISKAIKSRKPSSDLSSSEPSASTASTETATAITKPDQNAAMKKLRIHKFTVEGTADDGRGPSTSTSTDSCEASTSNSWLPKPTSLDNSSSYSSRASVSSPVAGRDYTRSDSVSTSGIGSELSDQDLGASGCWEPSESGIVSDDGVFSDSHGGSGHNLNASRQLQLWSTDSGLWSSADEGLFSSCNSSTAEMPSVIHVDSKSPEKRKLKESTSSKSEPPASNKEKRRSYAEDSANEWMQGPSRQQKRWSLAEANVEPGTSDDMTSDDQGTGERRKSENLLDLDGVSRSISCSLNSDLNLSHRWFDLLAAHALPACYGNREHGLYRVQSCPSSISGGQELEKSRNQVPDSPPEPISDSALLKYRACHNRNQILGASDNAGSIQQECCSSSFTSDDIWKKIQNIRDSRKNDSHSSSSTLASSSFSIVVQ